MRGNDNGNGQQQDRLVALFARTTRNLGLQPSAYASRVRMRALLLVLRLRKRMRHRS